MTDLINACFELGASIFLTLDCQALRKDRRVAGISVISRVFFVVWGLFNPYFYVVQGLTYSFLAGLVVCAVNLWWLGQYWLISREDKHKREAELKAAMAWDDWKDSLVPKKTISISGGEGQKAELLERINKVINTQAFEDELNDFRYTLFEFQATWHKYKTFEDMPIPYQSAILAGEQSLKPQLINIETGHKELSNPTVYDD